jgi:chromosome segregation ATPase
MIKSVIIGVLLGLLIFEKKVSYTYKEMYKKELVVNQEYNDYSVELQRQIKQYDIKLNSCFVMNYNYQQEQFSCYKELRDLKKWIREIENQCKQITTKCKKGL